MKKKIAFSTNAAATIGTLHKKEKEKRTLTHILHHMEKLKKKTSKWIMA